MPRSILLSVLSSSKMQLKWVQDVWVRPVSRYSPWKFVEIKRVQCKDVRDGLPAILTHGLPNSKNNDK